MSNLALQPKSMFSTEIATLTAKQHKHVIRDIEVIIEQLEKDSPNLGSGFKSSTYLAGNGKQERCFELDYDSTMLVITGYDAVVRMKVIKRWAELEKQESMNQPVFSDSLRAEESLRIADFLAQSLRVSDSGKLGMFQQVLTMKAPELLPLLPVYVTDAPIGETSSKPVKNASDLLKENGYGVSAQAFNKVALAEGYLEKLSRRSTLKGTKEFWSITDKGLKYGKNQTNPKDPRETQPLWYISTFKELADLILKGE